MRILITGANGLVGSACQFYALKKLDITTVTSKRNIFSSIKSYKSILKIKKKYLIF